VRVEADPLFLLPLQPKQRVGILFPRLSDVADRVVIDDDLRGAAGYIQGWVQNASTGVDVLEIPIQPEGDMLDLTLDWAAALDVIVFFCFDAHRFPGQRHVLEELQRRCKKLVVVVIANPWDRALIKEQATVLNTFGFRVPQLLAGVDLLFRRK
jgi:hypothetical protein